jgi:hypothetical protein
MRARRRHSTQKAQHAEIATRNAHRAIRKSDGALRTTLETLISVASRAANFFERSRVDRETPTARVRPPPHRKSGVGSGRELTPLASSAHPTQAWRADPPLELVKCPYFDIGAG